MRIADALDREHLGKVKDVDARVGRDNVTLLVRGQGDIALEIWTVERKAALFEQALRKKIAIKVVAS